MNSTIPTVSIVIPAYNRVGPLRHTLASADRAADQLGETVEIILVDDGSEPPLADVFASHAQSSRLHILRQPNQGSIVARLTGLNAACGEFVLFLDSDDLVATAKLAQHVAALRDASADISYDDLGELVRAENLRTSIVTRSHLARASTVEELLLAVQPVPHSPIYRRDYLLRALATLIIPPLRQCDAVGDIWLYYNLCIHPACLVKIDAPLTLIGEHDEARYSQHWERLGFAALGIAENFMRQCPDTSATANARKIVGERAFDSWRRLPRGFAPDYCRRLLALWRAAPDRSQMQLGGPVFRRLAALFGPVGAGRILRLRNADYAQIRTIDDDELNRLLCQQYNPLPAPNLLPAAQHFPFTPGRLLYLCYHRPKTWLQDLCAQADGRRGEIAMRAAATSLPPASLPEWGLAGPPCRFLTGARFVHQTIFCARSFEWACGTHVRLEIFGDGTLEPSHCAQLQRAFPHAVIASETETLARLDRALPIDRFPTLRQMRAGQPLLRKLLDLHAGFSGPALHLDSDMLFFNTPVVLRDWLRNPAGEYFMQQIGDALVGERDRLGHAFGQPLLTGVNTGIVAADDTGFDWPSLERAAAQLTDGERNHKWAEQSLFALHLSQRQAQPLSTASYFLCHDRHDLGPELPSLRHYVHKSKAHYTAGQWRLWLEHSGVQPGGPDRGHAVS